MVSERFFSLPKSVEEKRNEIRFLKKIKLGY